MSEKQTSYSIAEYVYLPSEGKIYSDNINPEIKLRAMTGRDEMKRLGGKSTQLKTMADVIEDCMIEKPKVSVYDMALGDYEYLLHRLRVITHGTKYKMQVYCSNCQTYQEAVTNLDQIQVIPFDEAKWTKAKYIVLPDSKDTITLHYQTPRMIDEQEGKIKEMQRRYKNVALDFTKLVILKCVIEEVNGAFMDELKLEDYIKNLSAKDMNVIIHGLDYLNSLIGLDVKLTMDCPDCGAEIKTRFRYGQEFYEPTVY